MYNCICYGKINRLTIIVIKVSLIFLVPNDVAVADFILVLYNGGQVVVVASRRICAGADRAR